MPGDDPVGFRFFVVCVKEDPVINHGGGVTMKMQHLKKHTPFGVALLFFAGIFALTGCQNVENPVAPDVEGQTAVEAANKVTPAGGNVEPYDKFYAQSLSEEPAPGEVMVVKGFLINNEDHVASVKTGEILLVSTSGPYSFTAEVRRVMDADAQASFDQTQYTLRVEVLEVFYEVPDYPPSSPNADGSSL